MTTAERRTARAVEGMAWRGVRGRSGWCCAGGSGAMRKPYARSVGMGEEGGR